MNGSGTRVFTIGSVLLVAVVAAVVSYNHMFELASRAGEAWRATLIPLSVDGMLVAATLAIVDRRRARQPAGWVPWTGLGLGLFASLAANIAAARPELVAQLVAAWPPVALALSIETLVIVLRNTAPKPRVKVEPKPVAEPKTKTVKAAPETPPLGGRRKPSEPAKRAQAVAEQHISEVGKLPSVRELERKAGVSRNLSQRTLTALRVPSPVEEVRRNGSPVSV